MTKSITMNSLFYFMNNGLNMIFPFLTSMYVSRILTPTSIGEVAYAQNVVMYFSILAFLGIPTYGLREISKARKNKVELSQLFSELFSINFISTVIFSCLYYGMIFIFHSFWHNILLYCVVGLTVVLNILNISWLYEGIEEYKYITIINIFFKVVMLAFLVLCVREPKDIIAYAFINVIGVAGNGIINVIHSRKIVSFHLHNINLIRHMRSIFTLVFVNLAIEVYTLLDTTMLGIMQDKDSVAFYVYASRINRTLLQITNTVTMVLVPRMAFYFNENKMKEFNAILTKALKLLIILGLPMIVGVEFTSDFLFTKIYGDMYICSAQVEKILCIVLLVSPIGYLLGSRVMLVSGKEKTMARVVGCGAIVNSVGNFFLIPIFSEMGAALASIFSEFVVAFMYIQYGRKVFKLESVKQTITNSFIATVFMSIYLLTLNYLFDINWVVLIFEIIGAIFLYFFLLYQKEKIVYEYTNIVIKKITRGCH